jgi:hypothetical protein
MNGKSRARICFLKLRRDGSAAFPACLSVCRHGQTNQHAETKLKLIRSMRRRSPTPDTLELRQQHSRRGHHPKCLEAYIFMTGTEIILPRSRLLFGIHAVLSRLRWRSSGQPGR